MRVPVSAPSLGGLSVFAGLLAGALFLLPRLASNVPFLALPLSFAGLFAATPLLAVRFAGRFVHALLALLVAVTLIAFAGSAETAFAFAVLFGGWALVAGEALARRKSVIAGCALGLVFLSLEGLLSIAAEGTAPMEATLKTPQVQAAFDQWAAQVPLEGAEAKTAIDSVRSTILALYPSLTVVSAATIVAFNAIALGRIVTKSRPAGFGLNELQMFRWPLALVVAFVASGALLLVPDLQSVAWNGFLVTMFLFLFQGLSVLSFTLTRLFSNGLMRTLVIIASLLGPWALFLSLLGLFDQWFDFRGRLASRETPEAPSDLNLQ
jgi:uncharacterized protein YybS (DUF2232 family)